jgi:hypothetical protein
MDKLIRDIDWDAVKHEFRSGEPFHHVAIDNFFLPDVAEKISNEFPDFNDATLGQYDNTFGLKKVKNHWDDFPKYTYQAFTFLGRDYFVSKMKYLLEEPELWLDHGLNGGGWHMHGTGGALNVHLDYNIHPKLGEQRKLNIVIYMAKDWDPAWGGGLELWSYKEDTKRPKEHIKTVDNIYNRAVLFDTTQYSWHGFQKYLTCPPDRLRKSLAAYYVRPAPEDAEPRGKALFVAREDQKNDPHFEELVKRRASVDTASEFYKKD